MSEDTDAADSRYASRKFLMACSVIVAAHVALGLQMIDAQQWIELLKWTVGLYCAGNVLAVAAGALKEKT